jgi:hypothetical protein
MDELVYVNNADAFIFLILGNAPWFTKKLTEMM